MATTRETAAIAFAAWAGLALSSCALPPRSAPSGSQWSAQPKSLPQFRAEGRLSASSGAKGGYANFKWSGPGPAQRLDLATPLGATVVSVCEDGLGAVAAADGRFFFAGGAGEMLRRLAGVDAPIGLLGSWALGYYDPKLGGPAGGDKLRQGRWVIERAARPGARDARIPKRLWADLNNGDSKIRVVFDDFELQGGSAETDKTEENGAPGARGIADGPAPSRAAVTADAANSASAAPQAPCDDLRRAAVESGWVVSESGPGRRMESAPTTPQGGRGNEAGDERRTEAAQGGDAPQNKGRP